ncbi:dTMP kinase [Streptomyces naganishii]|uniref:dTMP kinase n=1 Tax=Streptomyces naganishii TaxID=285447 RepID=UPI0036822847
MVHIALPTAALRGAQRVLLVALLAPALLIAVIATTPALLVVPFLRNGTRRTKDLLGAFAAMAATLLRDSRS